MNKDEATSEMNEVSGRHHQDAATHDEQAARFYREAVHQQASGHHKAAGRHTQMPMDIFCKRSTAVRRLQSNTQMITIY